jgi:hypothetical protein
MENFVWNKDLPGNCLSFEALWFFNASMNIITDIALLVLPDCHHGITGEAERFAGKDAQILEKNGEFRECQAGGHVLQQQLKVPFILGIFSLLTN